MSWIFNFISETLRSLGCNSPDNVFTKKMANNKLQEIFFLIITKVTLLLPTYILFL